MRLKHKINLTKLEKWN